MIIFLSKNMRVLIQRVARAAVNIGGEETAAIGTGLLILLGVGVDDEPDEIDWLVRKTCQLRIFDDEQGVMNRSVMDVEGQMLVVSQFTLHASTKKGNRPSYIRAARPDKAVPLYEAFVEKLRQFSHCEVQTGSFGADMKVELINDGPVTIWIDAQNRE